MRLDDIVFHDSHYMLTQRDSQHKKEIDLVAMKQGEKLYIQVANDISDTVSHVIGLANFNYTLV